MKLAMHLFHLLVCNVRINLRGGDTGVSQHRLHRANVGATHEQVGGKGMAQGVRRDVFGDARLNGIVLDQTLDGTGSQARVLRAAFLRAIVTDEEIRRRVAALGEVRLQRVFSR